MLSIEDEHSFQLVAKCYQPILYLPEQATGRVFDCKNLAMLR